MAIAPSRVKPEVQQIKQLPKFLLVGRTELLDASIYALDRPGNSDVSGLGLRWQTGANHGGQQGLEQRNVILV
jgi:hypothetical protein